MPRVLHVVEVAPLPLARIGERAGVAGEVGRVAEQERRDRQAAAVWSDRAGGRKRQLAGAVLIARHAQVPGTANVSTELDRVVADEPRDVGDELRLLLVLVERTVAAVRAHARAEP